MSHIMEEIRILQKLNHQYLVKYHETFDDLQYVYLVMDFVEGISLSEILNRSEGNRLSEVEAATYML